MPCAEHPGRIPPEHEEQLVAGALAFQLAKGVGCEGRAASACLDVRDLERTVIGDGEPHHLESLRRVRHGGPAVWRASRGNEDHAVELRTLDRSLGRREMPEMNRIKGAAEDPDPHG